MAVFIELTTDAFEDNFKAQSRGKRGNENRSSRAGRRVARRPLRGIEIKEDTYAMIKVIQADGTTVPLVDSTSPDGLTSSGYANFMLQSVTEARVEKHQIVETFGDAYIFFFGESPRFIDAQAVLLNTHDFNWRAEWWQNYNDLLRGTRLVETGARVYLFYDDIIIEGYLVHANVLETSQQPYQVTLQFRLFVTNYSNISMVGNPNFPVRSSVVLPAGVELQEANAGARLTSAFRDEALDQAELENFDEKIDGIQNNPIPTERRITDALRSVPRSFAVSQSVWTFLFSEASFQEVTALRNLVVRKGNPIRGLIAENVDEFVGVSDGRTNFGFEPGELRPPSALKGTVRTAQEVEDLWRESIQFLSCYGANINSPDAIGGIGLGVNFSAGIGASASASGFGAGASFGAQAQAGSQTETYYNQFGEPITPGTQQIGDNLNSFQQDPLAAVYGIINGTNQDIANRPGYTEGAGDPLYGYPSDFANNQPGFGVPGFNDFGGNGFGSAQGPNGDPGFKNPERFTFAGVAGEESAFQRFLEPREDPTAVTIGGGVALGTSGVSGGAGISVDGKPSAFAIISVPGVLDETGQARQAAAAIAARQEQQQFGFSVDNPFGVNCPSPGGFGFNETFGEETSFSDGFEYSLP